MDNCTIRGVGQNRSTEESLALTGCGFYKLFMFYTSHLLYLHSAVHHSGIARESYDSFEWLYYYDNLIV